MILISSDDRIGYNLCLVHFPLPRGLILHKLVVFCFTQWCLNGLFLAWAADTISIEGRRPNIILVLTDDQGYGDVSAHGNPVLRTPHLDRMHASSVRMTDFHVSPTCSPTRSALLTGRHEFYNGVSHTIYERERLSLQATTLATVLSQSGYATGIFGKWHLGDEEEYQPDKRGFDEVFIHGGGGIGQSYPGSCGDAPGNTYFNPTILHNGQFERTTGFCTDLFFQQATQWIDQQRQTGKPFFAYIATNAPHSPFTAKAEDADIYSASLKEPKLAHFYGMIHNIDQNLGRLVETLQRWVIAENTLLIFMNDNGTALGQSVHSAGMRGQKGSAWLGGTRVSCWWSWPGTLHPQNVDALTSHTDFFPTIAQIAGASLPPEVAQQIQGLSLVPLLANPNAQWPDRTLMTHVGRWPKMADPDDYKYTMAAVRTKRWSLISPRGGRMPQWQLFDVTNDYEQKNDVSADHPDTVEQLSQRFEVWWADIQPKLINERVIGPNLNPFAQRYWQQFGGEPTAEDYQRMDPTKW